MIPLLRPRGKALRRGSRERYQAATTSARHNARVGASSLPSSHFGVRRSGVLLHVASLPDGTLGPAAYRFVDWLAAAGQAWWQVLPLGPPNALGSPYEAASAFAGWPGLLHRPRARVTRAEIAAYLDRHEWARGWERFAGPGAVADQVRFDREWLALRRHANDRGIRILGDMPLYVAVDGADATQHADLVTLSEVGGCPPDYFSADGQRWGSPTYDWSAMRADGFAWWVARIARTLELVDAVRLDHFRGLVAYWAIPSSARTARSGRWRRTPGRALLAAIADALGPVPLVAEDLGVITPPVERLRRDFGFPGMAVLQFMVERGPVQRNPLWHQADRLIYTGTHDNDTAAGWLAKLDARRRAHVVRSLATAGIEGEPSPWSLVRLAHAAPARVAICPAQDLLSLGTAARMNTPGRRRGNWRWRLRPDALDAGLAARLREVTAAAGRAAG